MCESSCTTGLRNVFQNPLDRRTRSWTLDLTTFWPSLFSTSPLTLPKAETKPSYAGIKSQVSDTHKVVHISIDKDEQKRI
ncbi:uncharacterized protein [Malus domestica]|uniref:uncharacterized protein isoform X5 n=1 Tax=Malus domestica TaxID=3750 RepID=UPI0039756AB9